MAKKIARCGIKREKGWLYYLDKKGNVSRAKMARGGGKPSRVKPQQVAKVGVEREEGFLYFIDKDGDVARTKMARRGTGRRFRSSTGISENRLPSTMWKRYAARHVSWSRVASGSRAWARKIRRVPSCSACRATAATPAFTRSNGEPP